MNEKIVLTAQGYDRVDGRNAYQSTVKKLTLGAPVNEENKKMQIAAQLWKENKDGELEISMELPIHQIFDLMIFLSRTLLQGGLPFPPALQSRQSHCGADWRTGWRSSGGNLRR